MKTISCIIIVFALGVFGWVRNENKRMMDPINERIEIESKDKITISKEEYCSDLKNEIKETQCHIDNQLNK